MAKKGDRASSLPGCLTCRKLADRVNLSPRCILYWDEKGLIDPDSAGMKKNHKRQYNFQDVAQVLVIKLLREQGVSLRTIKSALKNLQEDSLLSRKTFVGLSLATDGKSIYIKEGGQLWNPVSRQMELFEYPFEEILNQTAKIIKLDKEPRELKVREIFQKQGRKRKTMGGS